MWGFLEEKQLKPSIIFPGKAYLTLFHITKLCMYSRYCYHCTELWMVPNLEWFSLQFFDSTTA